MRQPGAQQPPREEGKPAQGTALPCRSVPTGYRAHPDWETLKSVSGLALGSSAGTPT